VRAALPDSKLLYVETIANPNVTVSDLEALGSIASEAVVPCAVDNTFASPYLCDPARFGFDYVLHSATKYIGGHNDLIGGVVCTSEERMAGLRSTVIETGGVMAPLEAWLSMRGLMTLEVRMDRHSRSALALATWLEAHPKIGRVHYPGLPSHPQHEVAARMLTRGFGGMVAFEVAGGVEEGQRFCDALELAWVAASLGGVHTLVTHAASTTHRQLDAEARRAAGIADGLIRLSVGLEDVEDIMEDFDRALEKA
jgi:cystathionine beta-lyase/cystathionine gamma-synthase